ncbi:MAG: nucleotide exchange factor GrpE, partial [Candidatus Woesearchaeota archaeon]
KENNCENPETIKYRKGLELIYSQLYSTLEDYGLRIIDTKNQKFDPYKHEVLMVKESQEADDKILQEFQKGYFLNDTIIRHSKVMISKHGDDKNVKG